MTIDPSAPGRVYPPQRYEVSREKIREFAEAIGDPNPIYVHPDAARALGYDDVVAPPTFAMISVMRGFDALIADLGIEFARVVHVDQRFTYHRAIVAGDRLETVTRLDGLRQVAGNDVLTVRSAVRDSVAAEVCVATATLLIRPEEGDDE